MDILIETTRRSTITNKYQRGDYFITDKNKDIWIAVKKDEFVLQEHLKYLMYFDRSLRGYPKK